MIRKSLTGRNFPGLLLAGVAVAVALGGGSASAATAPLIPDIHSLGPLTLFDHHGHVLTGGSTKANISSEIGKATAPGPAPVGYRDGVMLTLWTPQTGSDPSQWNGAPLQGRIPDAIAKADQAKPLVATHFADNPLTLAITAGGGTSTGAYANLYQLRLQGILTGPTLSPQYYTATIRVDPATSTWAIVGGTAGAGLASASSGSSGTPVAPIIGGVVGGIVIIGAVVWWFRRRRGGTPLPAAPVDTDVPDLSAAR